MNEKNRTLDGGNADQGITGRIRNLKPVASGRMILP